KAIVAETVKQAGEYTATINLHKEVKAEVAFEVVAEAAE
ncbi:MAG: 50S ribosomal protein L9, partial [Bacteroidaceae bacterium]|nr:50S ribosomal protein L9 [Bacteroidaceae bacterium]